MKLQFVTSMDEVLKIALGTRDRSVTAGGKRRRRSRSCARSREEESDALSFEPEIQGPEPCKHGGCVAMDAELVISAAKPEQFPRGYGVPEIAFLGRSNVGKSSLLNCLVGNG